MQEVNAQTVDLGSELRIGVQTPLEAPPIIGGTPVRDQLLYRGQGSTLPPIIGGLALRPARSLQATTRIAIAAPAKAQPPIVTRNARRDSSTGTVLALARGAMLMRIVLCQGSWS